MIATSSFCQSNTDGTVICKYYTDMNCNDLGTEQPLVVKIAVCNSTSTAEDQAVKFTSITYTPPGPGSTMEFCTYSDSNCNDQNVCFAITAGECSSVRDDRCIFLIYNR